MRSDIWGEIDNLQEMLIRAATQYPGHGIGYVRADNEIVFRTYASVLEEAKLLLTGLNQLGIEQSDKIILALDKNEVTIPILWACLLGGIVPTILQPPVSFSEYNPQLEKLEKVFQTLNKPSIIFSKSHKTSFHSELIGGENIIFSDQIPSLSVELSLPEISGSDTAYIQFSSGSTGDPKGIILTHQNILTNLDAISVGLHFTHDTRTLNWMPLYHDMGLIGYHFTPIYYTHHQFHLETIDFIKRPFLWLDIMSSEKINCTGCPNFGLAIVLRHLKRKQPNKWDLSAMESLLNGAEPISVSIMNEFMVRTAPFNFRPEAMTPVYGMAESTLAITFSPFLEKPTVKSFDREILLANDKAVEIGDKGINSLEITGVGKAINDIQYRIVDDHDQKIDDGELGHIQISGPCVTSGYYNDIQATESSFCGEWLRTGDQGFSLKDHLYISGRFKDVIFLNGKNYFAHDLENMALQNDNLIWGKVIICGYFDQETGHDELLLFLVGSPNQKLTDIFQQISTQFRNTLGVVIRRFIPIKSNEIPRTSSGKIQRYKLINRYLKGEFNEIA